MEKIKKDAVLKSIENRSYENLNKGNKCFSQNKITSAISYYARAIYLNKKEPIFYFQKAEAYMLIGQTDNAIENYIVCLKKIKDIKEEEKIKEIEEKNKQEEEERKKMMLENEMLLLDKDSKQSEIELNNEKNKELNELYNNIIGSDRNLEKKESHNNSIKSKKNAKKRNNTSTTKIKKKKSVKNKKDVVIIKYNRSNKPIASNEEVSNNKNENQSESENDDEDEDEEENENENENKIEDEEENKNENDNKTDDSNENKNINNLQKEKKSNSTDEIINNSNSNSKLNNEINDNKSNKILKEKSINDNDDNIKNEHQSTPETSNENDEDDEEEEEEEDDDNENNDKYNTETEKKEDNTNNDNKNGTKENKNNKKDKKKKKIKISSLKSSKRNNIFKKQEEIKEIKTPEKNNPKKFNRKFSKKPIETPVNPITSKKLDRDQIIKDEPYCNSLFVSKRLCKALFCSGQLYVDSGIYDEALNCYSKILAIDKNYPHVNLILTCIYIEIQDKEKALYYINECINSENDNANYYVIRAKFYQMNNEVSLVNKDRLKIIALSPEHPELEPINKYIINMTTYYKNRADEMVQKEHFDIAVDFLNLAIELDSTDWLLYFKRGLLLCDIEKYEESIKDFEYLLYEIDHDKDKDSIIEEHLSTIYNQYATHMFKNGNLKKAIELLNQGIIYCSSNTVILRNLGDCYLTENKIDEALYEYKTFINEYKKKKIMTDEEKQEWIEVNRLCGIIISCYASKKYKELKFEESIEKYTEAISYYSFDVNFYIGRAKAYIHLNKFSNAAEDLCVILNLDPENKSAHSLLDQLENNFNTTGNQRIPAFHPQKILKNHPQTTLEAEKIIKERNQKKNEQFNLNKKNYNEIINENKDNNKIIKPLNSLSKNIKNISDIENNNINNKILNTKNVNNNNNNNNNNNENNNNNNNNNNNEYNNNNNDNNKSPVKYPECYKSLAKQVPPYLVNALFQNIPKEKVNIIKNKLIFSDPESGGIKEKIDTVQELNIKKFKQEIIICDDENENYETDDN